MPSRLQERLTQTSHSLTGSVNTQAGNKRLPPSAEVTSVEPRFPSFRSFRPVCPLLGSCQLYERSGAARALV
jgi:hypothetical protein